ncbi:MAG: CYTH and CHAD domain-containing protein [Aestuariivirga sp.]
MSRQHDQEIEVKFTCDAATLPLVLQGDVLRKSISHQEKKLRATYYDTPDLRLRKAHSVLRVRTTDGKDPVLCFKSMALDQAKAFQRSEIEVPAPQGLVDLSLFGAPTAKLLKRLSGAKSLVAQFDVEAKRQVFIVTHLDAKIEISADVGEIKSSDKISPILELELELKSGEEAALYDLALCLAGEFPLSLSFRTKSERGFRLVGAAKDIPVEPKLLELSPDMSMDDAIRLCLSQAIYHFITNWHASTAEHSPEAVHQMRIALRKLRTLVSVFSRSFQCPEFNQIKKQAGAIAKILGKARSLDVLAETLPKLIMSVKLSTRDERSLRVIIAKQRSATAGEISNLFLSAPATLFVLQAQHLVTARAWSRTRTAEKPIKVLPTSPNFARQALSKLHARVLKRGGKFETLSMEQLHSVRLSLKALSYAASAFAGLIPNMGDAKEFDAARLRLQQGLGRLNDSVFALHFFEEITEAKDGANKAAAKALVRKLKKDQASLKEKLHKRWKSFKKTKPYWV